MKRIEIIKNSLDELRNLDKRFSVFGANRHQYKWNKKLTENEINQIENDHQIVLSKEYKEILKTLGNGGPGNGYGLEKLSLKNINPPYMGTKQLLRNWEDPNEIDCDMVELDEISGYIKLFDYGCGMEYCLIATGEERGDFIFFDYDGRFEKIENKSLLDIYEKWVSYSLNSLKRVENKLLKHSVEKVITEEWEDDNFSIREMIYSIMDIHTPEPKHNTDEYKEVMETNRIQWLAIKKANDKALVSKKWWKWKK